jgi:transcriptional regulator with XRE-family HTH domain
VKLNNHKFAESIGQSTAVWRDVRRAEPTLQIRRLMRAKNLRNVDIAERLGISEANVSRLLRGNQNLKLDTLYSLADALNETLTIFIGALQVKSIGTAAPLVEAIPEDWKTNSFDSTNVISLRAYRPSKVQQVNTEEKEQSNYARVATSRR